VITTDTIMKFLIVLALCVFAVAVQAQHGHSGEHHVACTTDADCSAGTQNCCSTHNGHCTHCHGGDTVATAAPTTVDAPVGK